jgi:hypothetical protein
MGKACAAVRFLSVGRRQFVLTAKGKPRRMNESPRCDTRDSPVGTVPISNSMGGGAVRLDRLIGCQPNQPAVPR